MTNSNLINNIDFHNGTIAFSDLYVDLNIPAYQQSDKLKEDLLQITYPNNILIDMGWYPSFSPEGSFRTLIIKDYDWENPVFCRETSDILELIEILRCAADMARDISAATS